MNVELTIKEALAEAQEILRAAGLEEARRDATSLLGLAMRRDRTFLLTHPEAVLTAEQMATFRVYILRRASREPLQYIAGQQEFYGLDFEVTPDVLIPRPETELVVETALNLLKGIEEPTVCDVGTGSGCIIISLLHEVPALRGVALDLSAAALAVARRNAERHKVLSRLTLLPSDLFSALAENGSPRFSVIVSNPPYVEEKEIAGLQPEVRDYEPHMGLAPADGDGLSLIRRLLAGSPPYLTAGGYLIFEIGFNQAKRVEELIDSRVWTLLAIHRDLQGIPRTVVARLNDG